MSKPANIYGVQPKVIAPRRKMEPRVPKEPTFTQEFFIAFVSFTMLLYSNAIGTLAIVGFLAPWGILLSRRLYALPHIFHKCWPLLLLPCLTIASTLWSNEPPWTFRASLEFSATVLIAILAGSFIKPRILTAALLSSFVLIALLCMTRPSTLYSLSVNAPISGFFGSKNAFSGTMAMMMLTAIAVYLDKSQSTLFRLMSMAGILLTPILLYLGHSLDAIISVCFAISMFLSARFLTRFTPKTRLFICIVIFLLAMITTIFLALAEFNPDSILIMLGKDPTLTGRTSLWKSAMYLFEQRPFFGSGYNSFWRIANPNARQLWYSSHVPIGAGFNFHNEYLEILVELGLAGFILVVTYIYTITKGIVKGILGTMGLPQQYAFMLFSFFIIRTPVEASLFGQFNITLILFCFVWMYFTPSSISRPENPRQKWTNIYNPEKLRRTQ